MKIYKCITAIFIVCVFINNLYAEDYNNEKDAKKLIEEMVETVGDYNKLKSLADVQYKNTHRDIKSGKADISIERYIFNGELSWAKYTTNENVVLPDQQGEIIQGYNGKESWMTIDGEIVDDPQALKLADFFRKANFYWFSMMAKLLDPGINYSYKGTTNLNDIEYDLVEITFDKGVGDVSDTFLLYINPDTNLVDQFLFTALDFGVTEPFLMKVEYEETDGVFLPAKRIIAKSNWNGEILEDASIEVIMTDIKFKNGFMKSDFEKPN